MSTVSDTIENSEDKEKMLYRSITQVKFPLNPIEVIKGFMNLKKPQIIKLILSTIIIILFGIFNNVQILGNPQLENKCYYDTIHNLMTPLNNFFRGSRAFSSFVLIFASVGLDIIFLFSFFAWAIYAVDWRYGVNVLLFYGIRYIMNESARFNVPNLLYFPYPGFPSIVTAYIVGSDFFFSGHCGFPIVNMLEFIWMKKFWLAAFCAFASFVEIFMLLISKGHYTIDIIVGIAFSHYISILGRNLVKRIYDKINFLNKLKTKNRKELKRIKFEWDIGD